MVLKFYLCTNTTFSIKQTKGLWDNYCKRNTLTNRRLLRCYLDLGAMSFMSSVWLSTAREGRAGRERVGLIDGTGTAQRPGSRQCDSYSLHAYVLAFEGKLEIKSYPQGMCTWRDRLYTPTAEWNECFSVSMSNCVGNKMKEKEHHLLLWNLYKFLINWFI